MEKIRTAPAESKPNSNTLGRPAILASLTALALLSACSDGSTPTPAPTIEEIDAGNEKVYRTVSATSVAPLIAEEFEKKLIFLQTVGEADPVQIQLSGMEDLARGLIDIFGDEGIKVIMLNEDLNITIPETEPTPAYSPNQWVSGSGLKSLDLPKSFAQRKAEAVSTQLDLEISLARDFTGPHVDGTGYTTSAEMVLKRFDQALEAQGITYSCLDPETLSKRCILNAVGTGLSRYNAETFILDHS